MVLGKYCLSDFFSLGKLGRQAIIMHVCVCKSWKEKERISSIFFFRESTVLIMIE